VVVLEMLGDLLGLSYAFLVWGTRGDWLLEEDWGVGEVCGELELQVPGGGETASEGRWCSDEDSPGTLALEEDSAHT
jgi:hypothetical protein